MSCSGNPPPPQNAAADLCFQPLGEMRRACDLHSLGNTKGKKLEVNQDLEAFDNDEAEEVEQTTVSIASLSRDIHDLRLMVDKEDRLIRKIAAHQRKVFAYQRENHIFMFQYLGLKLPPELVLRDDDDLHSDITSDEAEEEVDDIDGLDSDDTSDESEQEVNDIDHLDSDGTFDEAEEVDDTDDSNSDDTSDEAEEEVIEQVDSGNDSTISLESCSQCIRDLELKMDRIIGNRRKLEADWRKLLAYMRERDSIIYQRLGFKPPPEPMESDVDSD